MLLNKKIIMLVGYTHSGKSTLAKYIAHDLGAKIICTNTVHDLLNSYRFFQDDNTIFGNKYQFRRYATKIFQYYLLLKLLWQGHNIILDMCNLSRSSRYLFLTLSKLFTNYMSIIILVNTPEKILLYRLQKADQRCAENNEKQVWIDLYNFQKKLFQLPEPQEADIVMNDIPPKYKGVDKFG